MTRFVIHIDKLVLRGLPPGDAEFVASALRQELHRLLTERDVASAGRDRAPGARSDANQLGRSAAAQIARRIRP